MTGLVFFLPLLACSRCLEDLGNSLLRLGTIFALESTLSSNRSNFSLSLRSLVFLVGDKEVQVVSPSLHQAWQSDGGLPPFFRVFYRIVVTVVC